MNILAFSDVHTEMDFLNEVKLYSNGADVIVCAGDLGNEGCSALKLLTFLDNLKKPVIIVPGNHDDVYALKQFCNGSQNCYFLHAETI